MITAPSQEVLLAEVDETLQIWKTMTPEYRNGLDALYLMLIGVRYDEVIRRVRGEVAGLDGPSRLHVSKQFEHLRKMLRLGAEQGKMIEELEAIHRKAEVLQLEASAATDPAAKAEIRRRITEIVVQATPYRDRLLEMERKSQEALQEFVHLLAGEQ